MPPGGLHPFRFQSTDSHPRMAATAIFESTRFAERTFQDRGIGHEPGPDSGNGSRINSKREPPGSFGTPSGESDRGFVP